MTEKLMIEMPRYLLDGGKLLQVRTDDDGYVHQSWLLGGGKVISFEDIPVNYPSGGLHIWDSIEEYVNAIKDVGWINDKDFILRCDYDKLGKHGFPFSDEEK